LVSARSERRKKYREDTHMKLPGIVVAAALLIAPAAALAAPGLVTSSVSLKAGPGPGFPSVDRIPAGARVNVHGCIRGATWCDVSWDGERGWVSARYLEYYYRNRYVYLPDYYEVADVPIVPFVLGTYWSNYYSGRPWYRRQAHWNNYWRSHARFATQVPVGRGGREVETRTRTAITQPAIRQQGVVSGRGMEGRTGRVTRGNETVRGVESSRQGVARGFREEGRQPIARGVEGQRQPVVGARGNRFEGNRFSAGPAAGHGGRIAQPSVGHPGGAPVASQARPSQPLAAHGQMGGGPRPMGGGMPNAGGGGATHINAAPHVGGAPSGGGHPNNGPARHL
jgi:uncharacterized protein YraI